MMIPVYPNARMCLVAEGPFMTGISKSMMMASGVVIVNVEVECKPAGLGAL